MKLYVVTPFRGKYIFDLVSRLFFSCVAFNILFYKYVVFVNICCNCLGWKLRIHICLRPTVSLSLSLSLSLMVFRVEEWTEAQTDVCTSNLFVWQVSSITMTIEYNILTSVRRVANRLVIIVEDFCCVHCFVRESNSPTDRQVISCSYICNDVHRQNEFVFHHREGSFGVPHADVHSDHVPCSAKRSKCVSSRYN